MRNESQKSDLPDRFLDLAVEIAKTCDVRNASYAKAHICKQLVRSGTSAGVNYQEACAAESIADFVRKLQIVLEKLRESSFWLKVMLRTEKVKKTAVSVTLAESEELKRIIAKSVVTAKKRKR